jgi:hypothetical protein
MVYELPVSQNYMSIKYELLQPHLKCLHTITYKNSFSFSSALAKCNFSATSAGCVCL